MKQLCLFVLFSLVAVALSAAQNQPSLVEAQSANGPATSDVRILSPLPGQTLKETYVEVRFELARPALSDQPDFLIQLDSADPIDTSETSYTFPDLQPGLHTLRVTLVDANRTPVQGGAASVQFTVPAATPPAHTKGSSAVAPLIVSNLRGAPPAAPIPPELHEGDPSFPLAGSPLPLISLIGFGLLLTGAVKSMRVRKKLSKVPYRVDGCFSSGSDHR